MRSLLSRFLAGGGEKQIILLRHGQTQIDVQKKRFIGQSDLPLSDGGRRQLLYWVECLAGLPLDRIVASDLQRCQQSAHMIAEGRSMPVLTIPALREIHLGQWENMTFAQVKAEWPADFRQRGDDIARFRPPGGESFADLQKRVIPAFNRAIDPPANRILIVGHAGVNRVILGHLLGMPLSSLFHLAQDYGTMNLITRRNSGFRISAINLGPDPLPDGWPISG